MADSDPKSPFVPPTDSGKSGSGGQGGTGPAFDFLIETPFLRQTKPIFEFDAPAEAPVEATKPAAEPAPRSEPSFQAKGTVFFGEAIEEEAPAAPSIASGDITEAQANPFADLGIFDEPAATEATAAPAASSELVAAAGDEPIFPEFDEPQPATPPEASAATPSSEAASADDVGFFDFGDQPAADVPSVASPADRLRMSTIDENMFSSTEAETTPASDDLPPTINAPGGFDFGDFTQAGGGEAPWMTDEAATPAPAAAKEVDLGGLFETDAGAIAEMALEGAPPAAEPPPGDSPFDDIPAPVAAMPAAPAEEPLPPDPEIEDVQPTPPPLAEDHPHMQTFKRLCDHTREASLLAGVEEAIGWDERCMMPAAGAEHRAQMTLLSGIVHERVTDKRIGEWLDELKDSELAKDPHDDFGATLREIRRSYDKRTKLPKSLVEELAHTAAMGQHVWQEARANDDFASFAPLLTKMVDLKRQQAEALGYAEVPYDALLDEFEPGELTSRVSAVLGALRDELVPLVAQVREGGRSPDLSILERSYPVETQRTFGRWAASQIGFDFERGRLDVTAHPFCSGLGPNDCRITTRYDENFFNAGFFGIMHEAGHGIYDQGLRGPMYGLPPGEAVSMGIHESQSRMWEILVGRSLPFWRHMYSHARRAFPTALGGVSLGKFYFAVNDVRPSLIRVEADEFTYNLHILIRFELEQALISGDLQVADLPGAWREKYKAYLGIDVPNDADGVLQDIHWSAGLFGYFPTYSLGNLYAAQFYDQADQELGGLARRFDRGEFTLLRKWLGAKIHQQGRRYTAAQLCERITGRGISHEPLIRHLRSKYDLLYAPTATPLDDLDVVDETTAPATEASPFTASVGSAFEPHDDTVVAGGFGVAPLAASAGDFGSTSFGGTGGGATTSAPTYKRQKRGA